VGLVELTHALWENGEPGSVVWSLFPVPRAIGPSATETIEVDYGGGLVRDTITPVANTDYFINTAPDGSGADESGNVTRTFTDYGGGARVVFANTVARTVHLTSLDVRGTPVRTSTDDARISYTPTGAPRFASKLAFSYGLASERVRVSSYATYLGDRYVTQRERLPAALLNKDSTHLVQMLARKVLAGGGFSPNKVR